MDSTEVVNDMTSYDERDRSPRPGARTLTDSAPREVAPGKETLTQGLVTPGAAAPGRQTLTGALAPKPAPSAANAIGPNPRSPQHETDDAAREDGHAAPEAGAPSILEGAVREELDLISDGQASERQANDGPDLMDQSLGQIDAQPGGAVHDGPRPRLLGSSSMATTAAPAQHASSRRMPLRAKRIPQPDYAERPHTLDTTVGAALLLRRISSATEIAPDIRGAKREAQISAAVANIKTLLEEVVALGKLESIQWLQLTLELGEALRAVERVRREARNKSDQMVLLRAVAEIKDTIDPKAFKVAQVQPVQADSLPALDESEHCELAAQALAAANQQLARFDRRKRGDAVQTIELMKQVTPHFNIAESSADKVAKPTRKTLKFDMEQAIELMDEVEKALTSTPTVPWNSDIAAGFDAEMRCRKVLGYGAGARAYSGTTDPEQAKQAVEAVAGVDNNAKDAAAWTDRQFETPQQAVTGVTIAIEEIFDQQMMAVKHAKSDLGEVPPPAKPSVLHTLVEIMIKTSLASGAGMIGLWIGKRVGELMDNAAFAKVFADGQIIKLLPAADQKEIRAQLIGSTAARAFGVVAAQDAAKDFFKSSLFKLIEKALSKRPKSNAGDPLSAFEQSSLFTLMEARLQARTMLVQLAPALVQADPGALQGLYRFLIDEALPMAYTMQYGKVMEEWQNLKAKAHAGAVKRPGEVDGSDSSTRDAEIDDKSVAGALDVSLFFDTNRYPLWPRFDSMTLTGAEPAARRHFRDRAVPLSEVGLNQHYKLRFATDSNYCDVHVGVGPDLGLRAGSLDDRDLAVLRVAKARQKMQSNHYMAALTNDDPRFSRFSKSELIEYLAAILEKVQRDTNTKRLA